jgi:hypothetical protein
MENKCSAHSKNTAEETGFEHDVIAWRRLTRLKLRGRRRAARRPVVLRKDERREIDFLSELKEAF